MAPSMFQRLGGFAKVRKIVSELYDRLLDSELERYFHGVEVRRLIDHQTKFIASIMGGPASFSDEHLHRAHAHLGISHAHFQLMAELLAETLEDFDLDPAEIQFVLREVTLRQQSVVAPPATMEA